MSDELPGGEPWATMDRARATLDHATLTIRKQRQEIGVLRDALGTLCDEYRRLANHAPSLLISGAGIRAYGKACALLGRGEHPLGSGHVTDGKEGE
jgi:hypothetical protein